MFNLYFRTMSISIEKREAIITMSRMGISGREIARKLKNRSRLSPIQFKEVNTTLHCEKFCKKWQTTINYLLDNSAFGFPNFIQCGRVDISIPFLNRQE